MKKILLGLCVVVSLYGVDYASMNTDELMSLRGSVPEQEREAFKSAVQTRVSSMSAEEKATYNVGTPRKNPTQDGSQTHSMNKNSSGMGSGMGSGGQHKQKGKNR